MMLSSTFWGNLSDRYGRKQVGRSTELNFIKLTETPSLDFQIIMPIENFPLQSSISV
jgi:hypothetical protein